MIYFISIRPHPVSHPNITILNNFDKFHEWITSKQEVCFDKEFNGLNEFYAIPFTTQVGDSETQFVIDDVSFPSNVYLKPYTNKLFIGHNIKIDIKVAKLQKTIFNGLNTRWGLDIRNVYDTMIVEQRLGLDSKRPNDLESVYTRRTGKLMIEKKQLQKSFATMKKDDLFLTEQILYAAFDVEILGAIKKEQERLISKFNMFLLMDIENKLVPILADMELEGFNLDEVKWKKNIEDNKLKLITIERELDNMLDELGVIKKKHERQFVEVSQGSLFGELIEEKIVKTPQKSQINYASSDQVLKLFELCDLPLPTEISNKKDKITGVKVYEEKESAGEIALNKFLIENPNTVLHDFIIKLIEQRGIVKELSSFGERFLQYRIPGASNNYKLGFKNRLTNKVHTIYKQCTTSTGRLSSGDSDHGFYNSQQLPAVPRYREAFVLSQEEIDNDWWITSCDLTGAETMFMCAFAKDKQLYKWAVEEDDVHSPLATASFRAIYHYRVSKGRSLQVKSLVEAKEGGYPVITLSADVVVTKKINEPFRRYFKNNTFAMVYQAKAQTVGKTLNIPKDEAQIVIDVCRSLMPDTFKMVDEAIFFALQHRYLVFNTRTNSRKYFMQGNIEAIKGEAANARIQGSQADAVKEAIVEIDKHFRKNNIPNKGLLQIHDELCWKHKGKENSDTIRRIMSDTATLYLEGFTVMQAEAIVGHCWIH